MCTFSSSWDTTGNFIIQHTQLHPPPPSPLPFTPLNTLHTPKSCTSCSSSSFSPSVWATCPFFCSLPPPSLSPLLSPTLFPLPSSLPSPPPPLLLLTQNKVFIHRGQPYERLGSFIKRLTDEFSTAEVYNEHDGHMMNIIL